jgi:hypothetical protein
MWLKNAPKPEKRNYYHLTPISGQGSTFEGGYRFKFLSHVTPDILFMYQAQLAGFVSKVLGSVLCGHLPEFPLP